MTQTNKAPESSKQETSVATVENTNQSPVRSLSILDIDALEKAQPAPYDLMSEYWTPANPGEVKRVIFDRIENSIMEDEKNGEIVELKCAFFYCKENGVTKCIRNGSKRLVGSLENQHIQQGTPLQITYLGKKTNSTNAFKSDNWQVNPLIVS